MTSVLIADDDELMREFLALRLDCAGYETHTACNGSDALDSFYYHRPDIVLLDEMMPGLSGSEVLAAMRAAPVLRAIPVVMMSAREDRDEIARAKAYGAFAFLLKPFRAGDLLDTVAACLAQRWKSPARPVARGVAAAVLAMAAPALAGSADPAVDRSAGNRWSVDLSQGQSSLSVPGSPDWSQTELTLVYRPTPRGGYTFELDRSKRFGTADMVAALRGDWRIGARLSAYAGLAVGPDSAVRERWRLDGGFGLGVANGLELGADTRLADYRGKRAVTIAPRLTLTSKDERFALDLRWINLWEGGAGRQSGWGTRLTYRADPRLRLFGGYARYPETDTGQTRQVRSVHAGAQFAVTQRITLSGGFARDSYRGAFNRRSLTFGLKYSWGRVG